jgi:hypothetical protein
MSDLADALAYTFEASTFTGGRRGGGKRRAMYVHENLPDIPMQLVDGVWTRKPFVDAWHWDAGVVDYSSGFKFVGVDWAKPGSRSYGGIVTTGS